LCAILPPKDEQEKIVEYIENKISKIDKLLNLEQECIKSLKEYKASLIDSVVTGKVKV
jgi:restriction modification system DNA specificity domain protein